MADEGNECDGLEDLLPEFLLTGDRPAPPRPILPVPQRMHQPARRHPHWRLTNSLYMMRAVRNMSQTELGDKVGVTRQTISNIEKRRHEPALSLALAIAEALEMPVEGIFRIRRPKFGPYE